MMDTEKGGSVFGASMLIAGCCIGAGMLGLPVVTREAGFIPSSFLFLISWLFMTASGLILLEVALWFPSETNMAEMARSYLGKSGEWITFLLMLFLMYALMTAYSAGSGQLIYDFTQGQVSPSLGALLFALILLVALMIGTKALDWFNRIFMLGLGLTYLGLVWFGIPEVSHQNLARVNFKAAFSALPIMIVSFGFQNLIPSLVRYLDRNVAKIRRSILIGSLIPLAIYLLWEYIILGLISDNVLGLDSAQLATSLVRQAAGGLELVIQLAEGFAFFAITTSFMGNALSVRDFIGDQVGGSHTLLRRSFYSACAVLPPLLFAYFNPDIFLQALGAAGSFSATLLFGLIPALICLKGRAKETHTTWRFPGGKAVLYAMIAFSLGILFIS